jgi:hypothetical protein
MPRKKRSTLPAVTQADIGTKRDQVQELPNGGWAWKCAYCNRLASSETAQGRYVCKAHGGRTEKQASPVERAKAVQEARPVIRPPGRPPVHGLYSKKPQIRVDGIVLDYQARQVDPDATDEDMLYLRAHLEVLKENAPDVSQAMAALQDLIGELVTLREDGWIDQENISVEALMEMTGRLGRFDGYVTRASGLVKQLSMWTVGIEGRHERLIKLAKDRADTRLKNKAAKELDLFSMMANRFLILLSETLPVEIFRSLHKRVELDLSEIPINLYQAAGGQLPPETLN